MRKGCNRRTIETIVETKYKQYNHTSIQGTKSPYMLRNLSRHHETNEKWNVKKLSIYRSLHIISYHRLPHSKYTSYHKWPNSRWHTRNLNLWLSHFWLFLTQRDVLLLKGRWGCWPITHGVFFSLKHVSGLFKEIMKLFTDQQFYAK